MRWWPRRVGGAEGGLDRTIHARFFKHAPHRLVCVEVGAARPDYLSMTSFFRDRGGRVIAIEPNPEFVAAHRARGHEVYAFACADYDADEVAFTIVDSQGAAYDGGAVSYESFSALAIKPEYAALKRDLDTREIRVAVRRLDTILATYAPEVTALDLVSVDVEGWELEVLRGLSFDRYQPKVLVIENLFDSHEYTGWLAERGYVRWKRIAPNDVYVRNGFRGY